MRSWSFLSGILLLLGSCVGVWGQPPAYSFVKALRDPSKPLAPLFRHLVPDSANGCFDQWNIVVIEDVEASKSVLLGISDAFVRALQDLGFLVQRMYCNSVLQGEHCGERPWKGQSLVLGAHALAQTIATPNGSDTGAIAALVPETGLTLPASSVILNTEFIPDSLVPLANVTSLEEGEFGKSFSPWATEEYAAVLRAADAVWEVSDENRKALASVAGVVSEYVPLVRASPAWISETGDVQVDPKYSSDVLFYGAMSTYRERVWNELKAALSNTTILSHARVYGRDVDALASVAKIVLSMPTWSFGREHKATRLAPLLANGRFVVVVAEQNDVLDNELNLLIRAQAVAVSSRKNLPNVVNYYLENPEQRQAIAANAKKLVGEGGTVNGILLGSLKDGVRRAIQSLWARRGCPLQLVTAPPSNEGEEGEGE